MRLRAAILALVAGAAGSAVLSGCGEAPPPAHLRIAGGDAARGKALIYDYGCGLCHDIDGILGADGTVGPPLDDYAQRNLVAGILPNAPAPLMAWLMDPPRFAPDTGMPDMGITEGEARDIAAYLYTLGADEARVYPPDPPLALRGHEDPALDAEHDVSGGYQASGGRVGAGVEE